jgi:hypothetical protein
VAEIASVSLGCNRAGPKVLSKNCSSNMVPIYFVMSVLGSFAKAEQNPNLLLQLSSNW